MKINGSLQGTRFFAIRQARKSLIYLKDILLADASIAYYLWQYRNIFCNQKTYLIADNQVGETL